MKKIFFDNSTFFYKDILNMSHVRYEILEECFDVTNRKSVFDDFRLNLKKNLDIDNYKPASYLDFISKYCIEKCIMLYQNKYNSVNAESWINIVRAKNPSQINFKKNEIEFHRHTDISKKNNTFVPFFTFVYYIQMPDNLQNNDGVLFLEGENKKIYHYLPKENDLIIMEAHIPHVPAAAYNSTKDRIVLACNVGFEKKILLY